MNTSKLKKNEQCCGNCIHYKNDENYNRILCCNPKPFFKDRVKKPKDYCPYHKYNEATKTQHKI